MINRRIRAWLLFAGSFGISGAWAQTPATLILEKPGGEEVADPEHRLLREGRCLGTSRGLEPRRQTGGHSGQGQHRQGLGDRDETVIAG